MEKRANKLVSLKAHLKGIILRELDLSTFKFLEEAGAAGGPSVMKRMKLVNALKDMGLNADSILNLCAPSVTQAFVQWLMKGNAYSAKSKVVVAIKANEGGRVRGAAAGNITYNPELVGIALYGAFTSRKEWEGTEARVQDYNGRWQTGDPGVKKAIEDKTAGEVELVCGKEGAGSLLMEYSIMRLMHLNAKKNTIILVNLAGRSQGRTVVYPLLNTIKRMGFVETPMDVVHRTTGERKSAAQVQARERTKWFALREAQWRKRFLSYVSEQLQKFAPINVDITRYLCPVVPKSGISQCT